MGVIPSRVQRVVHTEEVNCTPLSEVSSVGTPKRATHVDMRASTQASDEVESRGTASTQRVDLSIMVNR
jgi:hypothetical protein